MQLRILPLPLFAVLILSALQLFSPSIFSQSVRWEPSSGNLAKGQVTQLQLAFENCEPQGNTTLPVVPGLELQPNGSRSQNVSTFRGRTTQTTSLGINATLTTDQRVTIPAFKISTNKGRFTVPSVGFDVGVATVQDGQFPVDQVVVSRFVAPETVWVGEIFPLAYSIAVKKYFLSSLGSQEPEWEAFPLIPETWQKYQASEELKNGDLWLNLTYNTRAIAGASGDIILNPAKQIVVLITDRGAMFRLPKQEQFVITSDQPKLTVKPLPARAPESFYGAVGQFKLESKIVHKDAFIDEPIVWRLTLSGTGNWPQISRLPQRTVSRSFYTMEPQPQRSYAAATDQFEATLVEDVVLVPTKAGTYTLDPVEWTYFDPAKGDYTTISTQTIRLTVTGTRTALRHADGVQQVGGTPSHRVIAGNQNQPPDVQGKTNLPAKQ